MDSNPQIDLTTLGDFKTWQPGLGSSTTDDGPIQECITAWSIEFLRRTGQGDQGGDFTQSPFVNVCNWDEFYDGMGTKRLFLRNRPAKTVTALLINGIQITQSNNFGIQGWVLDGSGKSIALRSGIFGWPNQAWSAWQAGPAHAFGGGLRFIKGIQNIEVKYTAGFTQTPADVVQCANKVVAQNYRRRTWVDEESRSVSGGGGSTRFRSWDIPPECQLIVDRYTRTL